MKPGIVFLGALLAAGLPICSAALAKDRPAAPLRLETVIVRDPAVNNIEAFRILIPSGWKTSGGVVWHHDRSNLATVAMRVWNPNGPEALEIFPNVPFVWTQGGIVFFPIGSNYLGNEVRPVPADIAAFVQQFVLSQYRRQFTNPRITDRQVLPQIAETVANAQQEPGINKQVKAERIRTEYIEAGNPMQEDVYCVLVASTSSMLPGTTFWGSDRLYGFKTAKGKLDELAGLLHSISASVKVNMAWFNQYLQVVQMWQQNQMQSIRNAGELSRYIAKTNDEISAMNRQAYANQQASSDRINARFSRYVRGVESYEHPFEGRSVELPSGYREVWVSGSGEYLLSNDAGFNPNVRSTQSWRLMKPKE